MQLMVSFPESSQVVFPDPSFFLVLLSFEQMLNVVTLSKMGKSELRRVQSGKKTAFVEDMDERRFSLHH